MGVDNPYRESLRLLLVAHGCIRPAKDLPGMPAAAMGAGFGG